MKRFPFLSSYYKIVQNYYLSDDLLDQLEFLVSGVLIAIVSAIGVVGNVLLLILLIKQAVHRTFQSLLILLSLYDTVRTKSPLSTTDKIVCRCMWSHPWWSSLLVISSQSLTCWGPSFLTTYSLWLTSEWCWQTRGNKLWNKNFQIGSMFSTVALSIERYVAVVHPFVKYR